VVSVGSEEPALAADGDALTPHWLYTNGKWFFLET